MITEERQNVKKKKIGRFIVLFILIIMIFSNAAIRDKIYSLLYKQNRTLNLVKEVNIGIFEDYQANVIDNKLLIYNNKVISAYDFEGNFHAIKEISYEKPIVHIGTNNIYVCNKGNSKISALDSNGDELWTYEVDQSISYITEKDKHLIVFLKDDKNIEWVNILDVKGNVVAKGNVADGKIISTDICKDEKDFVLGTINTSNEGMFSHLIKYSATNGIMWQEIIEDEIIESIDILINNSNLVVTDSKIYLLSEKKALLWSREISETICDMKIDRQEKKIFILLGEKKCFLEIIDFNGRTINKIELDKSYDNINYYRGDVFLSNDNSIIAIKGNTKFLSFKSNDSIKGILVTQEYIILLQDEKIKFMKITSSK